MDLWTQQAEYNLKVLGKQNRTSAQWMEVYILGVISELGELLQEMNWKKHRLKYAEEFGPNVLEELTDLTKFTICMWQIMGVPPEEMLQRCWEKGVLLEQKFSQEHRPEVLNSDVMVLDLDGVIADFRAGFESWILQHPTYSGLLPVGEGEGLNTLHMDINKGWAFDNYSRAKLEFEVAGGYGQLPSIPNVLEAIKQVRDQFYLVVWTARPGNELERVWRDTWYWMKDHGLEPDEFHFGGEERVKDAIEFMRKGNRVIALEDNPTLIGRYRSAGVPLAVVVQPYNGVEELEEREVRVRIEMDPEVILKHLNSLMPVGEEV